MKRTFTVILCFLMLFLASCTSDNLPNNKETEEKKEPEQTYEIVEKELLTPETVIDRLCELGEFAYTLQTPGCNEVYNSQINLSAPVVKSYRLTDNYTGEYIQLLCLATEEDAKTASETYNGFDYTNRLGAMYLFGSSGCIDSLSLSNYEYPVSFDAESTEEPEAGSVAGIIKFIEDSTELCGGYYSPQTIAQTQEKIGQRYAFEGDILNLVHLTYHDGTVLRFVYIYEFENENDAILYEEDRAIFSQSVEDGVCIRVGNNVIYGNHSIVSEIN